MSAGGWTGRHTRVAPAAGSRRPGQEHSEQGLCEENTDRRCRGRPRAGTPELRTVPAAVLSQWRERFRNQSCVRCPRPGCWLEFPSLCGLKYHYQRCQVTALAERHDHPCPQCKATFSTEDRLRKHQAWSHPSWASWVPPQVSLESPGLPAMKKTCSNRSVMSVNPIPGVPKVMKAQQVSQSPQNGERVPRSLARAQNQLSTSSSSETSSWTSDSSGSDSDSPSPLLQEEDEEDEQEEEEEKDPERSRHRRKQKTPKKFTGDQPTISGTFGLKGPKQSEDKLKFKGTRSDWNGLVQACTAKDPPANHPDHPNVRRPPVLKERARASGRRSASGSHRHTDVSPKLQDALSCPLCQRQFCSRAGLEFHTVTEHRDKNRCAKEATEVKAPTFQCQHCGKTYRSKAGREYHLRSAHGAVAAAAATGHRRQQEDEEKEEEEKMEQEGSKTEDHMDIHTDNNKQELDSGGRVESGWPGGGVTEAKERPEHGLREEEEELEHGLREEEEEPGHGVTEKEEHVEHRVRNEEKHPEQELTEEDFGRTPSGRVRRRSAQVAVFHLQEIAEDELASDWGGRRHRREDLVPDSRKLNYTRPQPLTLSPGTVERWRMELKEKGFICCPNSGCEAVYSSAAGLKAHLAGCEKGGGAVGKYTCLLCQKEFGSESGVKYHIGKTHSQNWFRSANRPAPGAGSKGLLNGLTGAPESNAAGKKRGRKPKERPPGGSNELEGEACLVKD